MLAHLKHHSVYLKQPEGVSWVLLSLSLSITVLHLLRHIRPELLRVSKKPAVTQGRLQKHMLAQVWSKSMVTADINLSLQAHCKILVG